MNITRLTAIATAALAGFIGTARADDITPDPYTHTVSTLSRAKVKAELQAARDSGQLALLHGEQAGLFQFSREAAGSGKTRAQVRAEMFAARASGELQALVGEDSGSAHFARAFTKPDAPRLVAVGQ